MAQAALKTVEQQAPRFIDPNSSGDKQWSVLVDLIKHPPENSRIITISPGLAERVLSQLNTGNRKKRPIRIRRYGEAMSDQGWILSGDTIKFGRNGMLLDGQNRLSACVRAGVPFRTHVIFGIDEVAFQVIDTGKARTNIDLFEMASIPYPGIVGPAVRWLAICDKGDPADRGLTFSNQELWTFYQAKVDKEGMALAVDRAVRAVKTVPRGALAAHLYLFEQKHAATAKRFAADLENGVRVGKKLADKLKNLRKQNMGRLHERQINALLIQAWNAYRSNTTLTANHLNWNENKEYPAVA
jgi:hypothetical protein